MPIKTNILERAAFYTFNAAPAPMLDLAGALSYQAISAAVHLDLFETLVEQPRSAVELADTLQADTRGVTRLLEALEATGYVVAQNGRYANSAMTEKWFVGDAGLDLVSAVTTWDTFLQQLWPHAPQVIRSGKRPYDFYEFISADPQLSHAFQQMMVGNANLSGPDIIKKISVPAGPAQLLDVGGGHGAFAIQFCQAYPELRATIIDSAMALETAKRNVAQAGVAKQIEFCAGDLWQEGWSGPYDVILLFNLLHHFDAETNSLLLEKSRRALRAGGQVAILEQVEGQVGGSATNAIVRLIALMYFLFADGRVYTNEEISGLLTDAGFGDIRQHKLAKAPGHSVFTAVAV